MARWRFAIILMVMAGAVFAALSAVMHGMERRAIVGAGIRDQLTADGRPRALAELARTLRQSKLVTVEVHASVNSASTDDSWRGDVDARVEAPVRLLYGCDLSQMSVERVAFSPVTGAYLVRIPPPQRIATEVGGGDEEFRVRVGWMRFRSLSGEYHLGLARRDLYESARELTLTAEDAAMVRQSTLEQVAALVRTILGERASVRVVFDEGAGS